MAYSCSPCGVPYSCSPCGQFLLPLYADTCAVALVLPAPQARAQETSQQWAMAIMDYPTM